MKEKEQKFSLISEVCNGINWDDVVMDDARVLAVIPRAKLNYDKINELVKKGIVERREIRVDQGVNKLQVLLAELSGNLLGRFGYGFDHELLAKAIYYLKKVFVFTYTAEVIYAREINPIIVELNSSEPNTPAIVLAPRIP